ncbi:hypothetical protein AB0891_25500 [Streptomyces sp. NPDC007259]|uniref:hypothetical protein n=1 Tax=Streptomyces sp. NPDC007259 TaxID=3154319 RepID=UPI003455B84C
MTDYGADQARTIRLLTQSLAEMDHLRETSALREVLLDLSYALANLTGPVGVLTDAWVQQSPDGTSPNGDLPDAYALMSVAASLRQLAHNT